MKRHTLKITPYADRGHTIYEMFKWLRDNRIPVTVWWIFSRDPKRRFGSRMTTLFTNDVYKLPFDLTLRESDYVLWKLQFGNSDGFFLM